MSILAAVDGETVPDTVVEIGHDLASRYDEELLVLHVMPQEEFDARREQTEDRSVTLGASLAPEVSYSGGSARSGGSGGGGQQPYNLEQGQNAARNVARAVVRGTLDNPQNVTTRGLVGEPVEEILGEADREEARYLVIGGRRRTPVGKAVFGSITQSILLTADIPVMTVMSEDG